MIQEDGCQLSLYVYDICVYEKLKYMTLRLSDKNLYYLLTNEAL